MTEPTLEQELQREINAKLLSATIRLAHDINGFSSDFELMDHEDLVANAIKHLLNNTISGPAKRYVSAGILEKVKASFINP